MTTEQAIEHGTLTGYKVRGCRCEPCTAAQRRYENRRNRLKAYGQWQPYVDAEPVRQYARRLAEAGLGYKRIGQLAGVSTGAMSKLMYGDYGRGTAPSKRVRPATAAAILAVEANLDTLGATVSVDATGTRRRVYALAAMGWSLAKLARRLGVGRGNFGTTLGSAQVSVSTARAVRAMYDELWNQPPPEVTHGDKVAASRTRNLARARGWAPPLAWDDDTIDDPAVEPDLGENVSLTTAMAEDSDELLAQGYTLSQAAERLGVARKTLEAARSRAAKRAAA